MVGRSQRAARLVQHSQTRVRVAQAIPSTLQQRAPFVNPCMNKQSNRGEKLLQDKQVENDRYPAREREPVAIGTNERAGDPATNVLFQRSPPDARSLWPLFPPTTRGWRMEEGVFGVSTRAEGGRRIVGRYAIVWARLPRVGLDSLGQGTLEMDVEDHVR